MIPEIKNIKYLFIIFLAFVQLFISSCAKQKIDNLSDGRITSDNIASSNARIVLAGSTDIQVNGTRLSNWIAPDITSIPQLPPYPTRYFPETGKPGSTYFIPQQFMDAAGKAKVDIFYAGGGDVPVTSAMVENSYSTPWDYYYNLQKNLPETTVLLTQVPRPVIRPTSPQNILIRLLNLSSDDGLNNAPNETLSLAYSDGKPLGSATSKITKGKWSQYIEIPYGTYEFRVLVDGSIRQCPAVPPQKVTTASSTDFTVAGTMRYFTQRRLFQPGGVYTIAVTFDNGKFEAGDTFAPIGLNLFSVIADQSPAANLTYAKVQVANAVSLNALQASVDGSTGTPITFGQAGDYQILITGQHTIEIKDAAGKVLAQQNITVKGGDNITAWVYPKPGGETGFTFIQNNMSGIVPAAPNPDGADGSAITDPLKLGASNIQTRFLNFCPELAAVSFTAKNGQPFFAQANTPYPAASSSLRVGQAPDELLLPYPYLSIIPNVIEVYQSYPGSVPGDRLSRVAPLTPVNFIRMPEENYPNGLPLGEPGVYTVALIGHDNDHEQPHLIVIKHNQ